MNGPPPDPWDGLRRHTPARIALGRSGSSLPTAAWLAFAAAHAAARDAVHVPLDAGALARVLQDQGWATLPAASRASDRTVYLRRPDLGRRLDDASAARLAAHAAAAAEAGTPAPDLVVVAGDGLSAQGLARQAPPLLAALRDALAAAPGPALRLAPVVVATQARVALGDEVGERLGAAAVLMLVGERPGLSSPDSLGAYLSFAPRVGLADSARNCVSNIRPEGLAPPAAAARLAWLVREALRRRVTGIALKDDSGLQTLPAP